MIYFLTGHGGWKPKDGYFDVPKGTEVKFYTQNAKLMLSTDVYKIVDGSYTGDPTSVVGEFRKCQDMTLYPDDEEFKGPTDAACKKNPNKDARVVRLKNAALLSQVIEHFGAGHTYVWACCRDLSLRSTATQVYDPKSQKFVPGTGTKIATQAGINAGQVVTPTPTYINFDKKTWAWDGSKYTSGV